MKRFFKSIIACICGLTIVLSSAVLPAFARDGVIGGVVDGAQSFVEWSVGTINNFWKVIFGEDFNSASEEELKAAYNDYVETLPATGYNSAGNLIWQPTVADLSSYDFWFQSKSGSSYTFSEEYIVNSAGNGFSQTRSGDFYVNFVYSEVNVSTFPLAGTYRVLGSHAFLFRGVFSGEVRSYNRSYELGEWKHFSPGDSFRVTSPHLGPINSISAFADVSTPVFEIIPDTALSSDTYNINTRPTSITGGNYGIVGDNGQITKVEDNSTIVNETNNTFYNPATGQTVPITGWSYDYSDRSYKVTLESGDTVTVTYGDEYITIKEGDTIYNVYYLIDGSGSENLPCEHDWQEASSTDPTCTLPGKVTLSCTKCQQTKTETIPALGHNWQVKQTVTTQYDEEGNLTQQGYTIFECSRCHEQYKSSDGTIPPGGGSGTDPGSEEGETIWDKLGKLLGTAVKGLLDLLGAAIDTVLGGLIDFITNLVESLKQLVDLFGSVGEAFQVLWTWLPPEITAILVAGVSIFVFVALLKFFMK